MFLSNPIFNLPFLKNSLFLSRNLIRQTHKKVGEGSYRFKGVEYEKKCQVALSTLFKVPVDHVGRSGDGGIDLVWSWSKNNPTISTAVNTTTSPAEPQVQPLDSFIDFIAQCKLKECGGVGPHVVRELIGVLSKEHAASVGCLCTNKQPTIYTLQTFKDSDKPLMLFLFTQLTDSITITIKSIIVNDAFQRLYPHIVPVKVRNSTGPVHYTYTISFRE